MSITDIFLKSSDRSLIENLLQQGGERRRGEEEERLVTSTGLVQPWMALTLLHLTQSVNAILSG